MMRKIVWILGTLVIVVSIAWVNRIDILLQIPRIKAHFKEPIGPNREVVWDKGPMTSSESPSQSERRSIVVKAPTLFPSGARPESNWL